MINSLGGGGQRQWTVAIEWWWGIQIILMKYGIILCVHVPILTHFMRTSYGSHITITGIVIVDKFPVEYA